MRVFRPDRGSTFVSWETRGFRPQEHVQKLYRTRMYTERRWGMVEIGPVRISRKVAVNDCNEPTSTYAASRTDVSIARDTVFAFQRPTSNHFTQIPFLVGGLFLREMRGVVNLRSHKSTFIHDLAHYITDGIRNLIHQCLYCPIV